VSNGVPPAVKKVSTLTVLPVSSETAHPMPATCALG
jgi:hypothetical protein